MSSYSLKLTDAIKGNKRGLDRLINARESLRSAIKLEENTVRNMTVEIEARHELQVAMEHLQAVLPQDETIKFIGGED